VGTFDATSGQTPLRGVAAFVQLDDRLYRLVGYAGRDDWHRYSRSFGAAVRSFGPLRERWALDRQPHRIEVVVPPSDMTLAQFMARYPSTVPEATIALINQLQPGELFRGGRQAKRVAGGDRRM
jgi:predicted Zn-dependent protease